MEAPPHPKRDLFDWVQTGSQVYAAAQLGKIAAHLDRQQYEAVLREEQQRFAENRAHSDRWFHKSVRSDFSDNLYGLFELETVGEWLNTDRYISPACRAACREYLRLRMNRIESRLPDEVKGDVLWFNKWVKNQVLGRVNAYCAKTAEIRDVPARPGMAIFCGVCALALLGTAPFLEGNASLITIALGFIFLVVALATSVRRVFVPELVFDESWDDQFQFLGEQGVLSEEQVRTRDLGDLEVFKARMAAKKAEIDASSIAQMYQSEKAEHVASQRPVTPEGIAAAEAREEFEKRYARRIVSV